MKKRLLVFAVLLALLVPMLIGCGLGKIDTVNGVLDYATPGMVAGDLKDKCDPAFLEGGFSAYLVTSVNLETMEIELAPRLSDAVYTVWVFEGMNDAAVVELDKAFGAQTVVQARRASIPAILVWRMAKWEMVENRPP